VAVGTTPPPSDASAWSVTCESSLQRPPGDDENDQRFTDACRGATAGERTRTYLLLGASGLLLLTGAALLLPAGDERPGAAPRGRHGRSRAGAHPLIGRLQQAATGRLQVDVVSDDRDPRPGAHRQPPRRGVRLLRRQIWTVLSTDLTAPPSCGARVPGRLTVERDGTEVRGRALRTPAR
jgi:hypothetical protein